MYCVDPYRSVLWTTGLLLPGNWMPNISKILQITKDNVCELVQMYFSPLSRSTTDDMALGLHSLVFHQEVVVYFWKDITTPPSRCYAKCCLANLDSISLVWSVRMELSALTMTARADVTPPFSSLFTLFSMKSFLSWEKKVADTVNRARCRKVLSEIQHFLLASGKTEVKITAVFVFVSFFSLSSYLGMLLRHMLLGELGQLNQLRDDLFLVMAVGAVNQDASDCVQDCLILRLETQRGENGVF